jgi:hypothetical protein
VILTLNAGMDLYGHAETDPALDVAVSHALLQRTARDGAESLSDGSTSATSGHRSCWRSPGPPA